MRKNGKSKHPNQWGLPASFEAREVFLNFDAPSLASARVRCIDRGDFYDWEIVLPTQIDTQNKSHIVLPWEHLPFYTALHDTDEVLFKEVRSTNVDFLEPFHMRQTRLTVRARNGLTAEIRREAEEILERDKSDRQKTYLHILAQLTRICGVDLGDAFMASANTNILAAVTQGQTIAGVTIDSEQLIRRVIQHFIRQTGVTEAEARSIINDFADLAAPFGPPAASLDKRETGFLSRHRNNLAVLEADLGLFEEATRLELKDPTAMVRFAVKDFLQFVDSKFEAVDTLFEDPHLWFIRPGALRRELEKRRRDVGYALDGWPPLIRYWRQAREAEADQPEDLDHAIRFLFGHVPIMPENEIIQETEAEKVWESYEYVRRKMVPMVYHWNEEPDWEMVERLQKVREEVEAEQDKSRRKKKRQ